VRLATAPVTWGVWERTTGRDDLVPAELLLETFVRLGYTATELGPPGYFSPELLERYGLELVGGFAPLHFADGEAYAADLPTWLDPIVDAIAAAGAQGPVVLAHADTDERLAAAGREAEQLRTALPPDAFERSVERINDAVERCRSRGVDVVFHHHAGTYVESPAEIEALLERTDVGICFDTGHALVGGGDPVEVARLCGSRIEHLHLKDVDGAILERLRRGEIGLAQAWPDGIFCPFGDGAVDLAAVLALPELAGYDGWIVLEQDRVAARVDDLRAIRAVEEANLRAVAGALTLSARR
jgi:inosose dehydratase